jgi:translation elongation factor EF-Tu-like GTPase
MRGAVELVGDGGPRGHVHLRVPGDDIPIIKGSALNALTCESGDVNDPDFACIKELLDAVDSYIPLLP